MDADGLNDALGLSNDKSQNLVCFNIWHGHWGYALTNHCRVRTSTNRPNMENQQANDLQSAAKSRQLSAGMSKLSDSASCHF
jgi:hypothetical protein